MEIFIYSLLLLCALTLEIQGFPDNLHSSFWEDMPENERPLVLYGVEFKMFVLSVEEENLKWHDLRNMQYRSITLNYLCRIIWNVKPFQDNRPKCEKKETFLIGNQENKLRVKLPHILNQPVFPVDLVKCDCKLGQMQDTDIIYQEEFYIFMKSETEFFKIRKNVGPDPNELIVVDFLSNTE